MEVGDPRAWQHNFAWRDPSAISDRSVSIAEHCISQLTAACPTVNGLRLDIGHV